MVCMSFEGLNLCTALLQSCHKALPWMRQSFWNEGAATLMDLPIRLEHFFTSRSLWRPRTNLLRATNLSKYSVRPVEYQSLCPSSQIFRWLRAWTSTTKCTLVQWKDEICWWKFTLPWSRQAQRTKCWDFLLFRKFRSAEFGNIWDDCFSIHQRPCWGSANFWPWFHCKFWEEINLWKVSRKYRRVFWWLWWQHRCISHDCTQYIWGKS